MRIHLAFLQLLRNDVCADFLPFDYVASVLGVPAHGTGTGAFVEAIVDLFCGEWEASESGVQRGCGFHGGCWLAGLRDVWISRVK